jgi:hypothetical protein
MKDNDMKPMLKGGEKKMQERLPFDFEMSSTKISKEEEEAVCNRAKKNAEMWFNSFSKNNDSYKEDSQFALGQQWDVGELSTLKTLQQTAVTMNKLYALVRGIVGEFIQASPEIEAFSLSGRSEEELIKFYQDYFNTVSYSSEGKIIWKTAIMSCLMGGFSVIEVCHGEIGEDTLEQNMYLEVATDPTLYYFDPSAKKKSKSDGQFCGKIVNMGREEFQAQHPHVDIDEAIGNSFPDHQDRVQVNVYQEKQWYQASYLKVKSGKLWKVEAYDKALDEYYLDQESVAMQSLPGVSGKIITQAAKQLKLPDDLHLIDDKIIKRSAFKIRTYKILGMKVIEHSDWISDKYLGFIFVDGDSHWVDGEQVTRSIVTDARDPQKMLNTASTKIQFDMQTMRGERWLGTRQHVKGFDKEWRQVQNQLGMMMFNEGSPALPMPTPIPPAMISPSLFEVCSKSEADIYTCIGLNASWRGDADTRTASGEAIKRETSQGNKTTMVQFDGVYDAMTQVGKVLFDAAPRVLDTNRIMHLQGRDGETKIVEINKVDQEGRKQMDLSKSKYDIAIKAGLSFELQREMAFKVMTAMMQAAGPSGTIMLDKMAENLPVPGALELGRRFKSMIPENVIAAGEGKEMPPPPPPPPDPRIEIENRKLDLKTKELEGKAEALHASMIKMQADLAQFMENVKVQTMKGLVEIAKMTGNAQQAQEAVQERKESRVLKTIEVFSKLGMNL